jgi:hypothetical protein
MIAQHPGPKAPWIPLRDITARHMRRVGLPLRHLREFLTDSEKWSLLKGQDFWQALDARAAGPGQQLLSVLPPSTSSMPDFRQFQNELAGYNEIVRWPLYSAKAYATGGQTQLTFFDQSEGLATNGRADTNMQAANQLPGNQMHVALSLRCMDIAPFADVTVIGVVAGTAAQESYRLLTNLCWCEVTISDKIYLIAAPLTLLPAGQGVGTFVQGTGIALSNNFSHANNGIPSNEAIYRLDPPLGILPTRTFNVTANWRAAQAVTTAHRMMMNLDGWRLRAVQ